MGAIHTKEKWDCNQYLKGQGPPGLEDRAVSSRRAESVRKEEIRGNQPDGEMIWTCVPRSLPCYLHCGTIEIEYSFNDGIQTERHPKPGRPYGGMRAIAYLPDDREGNKLLQLLRQAFDQRLTFTVATGSSGAESVTWSDIPHCTGFSNPDPQYLQLVRQVLKSKGIE